MHYEYVALGLSAFAAGLSYWYSRVAIAAKEYAEAAANIANAHATTSSESTLAATQILEVAKTSVQSSNHEVCSECNKLVARFERLENGSVLCANCTVKE